MDPMVTWGGDCITPQPAFLLQGKTYYIYTLHIDLYTDAYEHIPSFLLPGTCF